MGNSQLNTNSANIQNYSIKTQGKGSIFVTSQRKSSTSQGNPIRCRMPDLSKNFNRNLDAPKLEFDVGISATKKYLFDMDNPQNAINVHQQQSPLHESNFRAQNNESKEESDQLLYSEIESVAEEKIVPPPHKQRISPTKIRQKFLTINPDISTKRSDSEELPAPENEEKPLIVSGDGVIYNEVIEPEYSQVEFATFKKSERENCKLGHLPGDAIKIPLLSNNSPIETFAANFSSLKKSTEKDFLLHHNLPLKSTESEEESKDQIRNEETHQKMRIPKQMMGHKEENSDNLNKNTGGMPKDKDIAPESQTLVRDKQEQSQQSGQMLNKGNSAPNNPEREHKESQVTDTLEEALPGSSPRIEVQKNNLRALNDKFARFTPGQEVENLISSHYPNETLLNNFYEAYLEQYSQDMNSVNTKADIEKNFPGLLDKSGGLHKAHADNLIESALQKEDLKLEILPKFHKNVLESSKNKSHAVGTSNAQAKTSHLTNIDKPSDSKQLPISKLSRNSLDDVNDQQNRGGNNKQQNLEYLDQINLLAVDQLLNKLSELSSPGSSDARLVSDSRDVIEQEPQGKDRVNTECEPRLGSHQFTPSFSGEDYTKNNHNKKIGFLQESHEPANHFERVSNDLLNEEISNNNSFQFQKERPGLQKISNCQLDQGIQNNAFDSGKKLLYRTKPQISALYQNSSNLRSSLQPDNSVSDGILETGQLDEKKDIQQQLGAGGLAESYDCSQSEALQKLIYVTQSSKAYLEDFKSQNDLQAESPENPGIYDTTKLSNRANHLEPKKSKEIQRAADPDQNTLGSDSKIMLNSLTKLNAGVENFEKKHYQSPQFVGTNSKHSNFENSKQSLEKASASERDSRSSKRPELISYAPSNDSLANALDKGTERKIQSSSEEYLILAESKTGSYQYIDELPQHQLGQVFEAKHSAEIQTPQKRKFTNLQNSIHKRNDADTSKIFQTPPKKSEGLFPSATRMRENFFDASKQSMFETHLSSKYQGLSAKQGRVHEPRGSSAQNTSHQLNSGSYYIPKQDITSERGKYSAQSQSYRSNDSRAISPSSIESQKQTKNNPSVESRSKRMVIDIKGELIFSESLQEARATLRINTRDQKRGRETEKTTKNSHEFEQIPKKQSPVAEKVRSFSAERPRYTTFLDTQPLPRAKVKGFERIPASSPSTKNRNTKSNQLAEKNRTRFVTEKETKKEDHESKDKNSELNSSEDHSFNPANKNRFLNLNFESLQAKSQNYPNQVIENNSKQDKTQKVSDSPQIHNQRAEKFKLEDQHSNIFSTCLDIAQKALAEQDSRFFMNMNFTSTEKKLNTSLDHSNTNVKGSQNMSQRIMEEIKRRETSRGNTPRKSSNRANESANKFHPSKTQIAKGVRGQSPLKSWK